TTVSLEPVGRLFERLAVEPRGPELCGSGPCDQAGVLEDLEVPRDGLNRDRERLRELVHAGFSLREALGGCPPGGVGEGCERPCQLVGRHDHSRNRLINTTVEYGIRTTGERRRGNRGDGCRKRA